MTSGKSIANLKGIGKARALASAVIAPSTWCHLVHFRNQSRRLINTWRKDTWALLGTIQRDLPEGLHFEALSYFSHLKAVGTPTTNGRYLQTRLYGDNLLD